MPILRKFQTDSKSTINFSHSINMLLYDKTTNSTYFWDLVNNIYTYIDSDGFIRNLSIRTAERFMKQALQDGHDVYLGYGRLSVEPTNIHLSDSSLNGYKTTTSKPSSRKTTKKPATRKIKRA